MTISSTTTITTLTSTSTTLTSTTMTTTTPWNSRLFCFCVLRNMGEELALVRTQQQWGAGVFACEAHLILGPAETEVSKRLGDRAGNDLPNLYLTAWEEVKIDGQYKAADWVVKVDPDTVFLANRLRFRLAGGHSANTFFANCGARQVLQGPAHMLRTFQVFARGAVDRFLGDGQWRCPQELGTHPPDEQEAGYMAQCLQLLGVNISNADSSIPLLEDPRCGSSHVARAGCVSDAAAFSSFSKVDEFNQCWFAAKDKDAAGG